MQSVVDTHDAKNPTSPTSLLHLDKRSPRKPLQQLHREANQPPHEGSNGERRDENTRWNLGVSIGHKTLAFVPMLSVVKTSLMIVARKRNRRMLLEFETLHVRF
jgi:hypothetical protein